MNMKFILLVSVWIFYLPQSFGLNINRFQGYTLVCEKESFKYYSEKEFDLYQYYGFYCPDVEDQVRGPSNSVLIKVKSPLEDSLNVITTYVIYPDYDIKYYNSSNAAEENTNSAMNSNGLGDE